MTARKLRPLDEADLHDIPASTPKTRHCLRCQTEFASAWAGERVCPRCKGTSGWRTGVALQGARTTNGR